MTFFLIDYIFDSCEPGLIPKPDTITGCGPECVVDPDCQTGYICQDQKYEYICILKIPTVVLVSLARFFLPNNIDLHFRCIEKPDPCNPSPCGPGTMCMANKFGNPICRCLGKLVPKPDTITGCGPECTVRNAFIFDYHKYSLLNVIV